MAAAAGIICQACGVEAPTRYVEFHQNIGALVMRFSKSCKGNLCKRCVHRQFWSLTPPTLLIGWLGYISLVLAPCFVINNVVRYVLALGMPRVPPGAALPQVTDDVVARVSPHLDDLFARLNRGEQLIPMAQQAAPGIGVTPGQLVKFLVMVVDHQRQQAANNRPTGGFPVMQAPQPVIPVSE